MYCCFLCVAHDFVAYVAGERPEGKGGVGARSAPRSQRGGSGGRGGAGERRGSRKRKKSNKRTEQRKASKETEVDSIPVTV